MAAKRDELGICAQVSLRYEMPYLLSWVAYHTLLGFDRILLYLDDLKHLGQVDGRKQARMLQVLGRARHVTVLLMSAHNMTGPADQLRHCVWTARKRAVWMAMWDIDEVPALGPPPSALPTADELRVPTSLKSLLKALPNRTAGLLVPRLQFDCNGLDTPAQRPLIEYEAFTRRSCAPDGGGKVLWRGDATGTGSGVRPDSFHTLTANRRAALRDPDGRVVSQWDRCCDNSTNFGWWRGSASPVVGPDYSLTPRSTALRLHHFVTRSASECRQKKGDQSKPGSTAWGHAWRAHADSQGMCGCSAKLKCGSGESDLSLAQYGRAIRVETLRLFDVASVND